jgi:hypothetical protein
MILQAEGRVRLAAYDEKTGDFVDLGWHDSAGLAGWTIADYDWTPLPEETDAAIPSDVR